MHVASTHPDEVDTTSGKHGYEHPGRQQQPQQQHNKRLLRQSPEALPRISQRITWLPELFSRSQGGGLGIGLAPGMKIGLQPEEVLNHYSLHCLVTSVWEGALRTTSSS